MLAPATGCKLTNHHKIYYQFNAISYVIAVSMKQLSKPQQLPHVLQYF